MTYYELYINNFQIIHKAHIKFKTGLTLITGKSNNGKSSIFKAFKQLTYNTPGTTFISHNHSKTTLQLKHIETQSNSPLYDITYTKTPQGGQYTLTTPTQNEVYSKLGTQQLDPIKQTTHINKEFNYNFWNQLEKPFLISLSPKEQFELLQNSPTSKSLNQALQSLTQDRKLLSTTQIQNQSQLQLLQNQNEQYHIQLQNLPTLTSLFNQLTTLQQSKQSLQKLQDTLINHNQINLNDITHQVHSLKSIPSTQNLLTLHNQISTLQQVYSSLLKTTKPINDIKHNITTLSTTQNQISTLLQTHFTICPLCNQPFQTHITLQGGQSNE